MQAAESCSALRRRSAGPLMTRGGVGVCVGGPAAWEGAGGGAKRGNCSHATRPRPPDQRRLALRCRTRRAPAPAGRGQRCAEQRIAGPPHARPCRRSLLHAATLSCGGGCVRQGGRCRWRVQLGACSPRLPAAAATRWPSRSLVRSSRLLAPRRQPPAPPGWASRRAVRGRGGAGARRVA
jgi:hypothetical protein